jgi:hypothetical protein
MPNRYNQIRILNPTFSPKKNQLLPRRITNVKYPEIKVDSTDFYVYTTRGDRYDTIATSYYKSPSLWWIIARANVTTITPDSLIPTIGSQIRIPNLSRVSTILEEFKKLNILEDLPPDTI